MSLTDVVAEGELRGSLIAIRDHLAEQLETRRCKDCGSLNHAGAAALAKQLTETITRLNDLPSGQVSKIDELASKRKAARAGGVAKPRKPGAKSASKTS